MKKQKYMVILAVEAGNWKEAVDKFWAQVESKVRPHPEIDVRSVMSEEGAIGIFKDGHKWRDFRKMVEEKDDDLVCVDSQYVCDGINNTFWVLERSESIREMVQFSRDADGGATELNRFTVLI